MKPDQIKSLAEAVAAIAEVKSAVFWDVLTDLRDIGIIDSKDFDEVENYMESL
jgi:hypothetical protein